ncbi:hypothetical protein CO046_03885 [Candidatus Peregrinibacteria bacterium CG_4_9_14_0_2_um_filter_53_11]|nr:MAG: hypothetical protein CO046_03885 [Candidatus Peregrinibacteria bacterium CG_4_9_14_0_2_um_filter_53_11]
MARIIKKSFFYLASAVTLLTVAGFVHLEPVSVTVARAASPASCTEITLTQGHATADIIEPGNSGGLVFSTPSAPYSGCIEDEGRTRTLTTSDGAIEITANFLRGWSWNTNLGLMSWGCESGSNAGAPCGAQNYGGYLTISDAGDANLTGFAWGDGLGWLSLGCRDGDNSGVNCGGVDYGVSVALEDGTVSASCQGTGPGNTLNAGDLYGYAWNDAVGWMSFCGGHVDIESIDSIMDVLTPPFDPEDITIDVGVQQFSPPDGDAGLDYIADLEIAANEVYANNADYHKISVSLSENGQPIVPSPTRSLTVSLSTTNTIRTDQTVPCSAGCTYNAVTVSPFIWSAASGSYTSKITSKAPSGDDDRLLITGMSIELRNPTAGNELLAEFQVPADQLTQELSFAAPVVVNYIAPVDLDGTAAEGATLSILPNTAEHARVSASQLTYNEMPEANQISVTTQLYSCSDTYGFVFDDNGNGTLLNEDGDLEDTPLPPESIGSFPAISKEGGCREGVGLSDLDTRSLSSFVGAAREIDYSVYALLLDPTAPADAQSDALVAQTIISYTRNDGSTIRYFSKGLDDNSLINQSATVRGNVEIDILDTQGLPAENRIGQSVGKNARSKREPYYRAIQSLLGRRTPAQLDNTQTAILRSEQLEAGANGIVYYKRNTQPGLPAAPCTLILTGPAGTDQPLSLNRDVTLVSEGCNVFIDRNIRGGAGRLGVIALEDYKLSGANRGGNVYVCSQVTDIEANFVLDNSLLSYVNTTPECGGSNKSAMLDAGGFPLIGSVQRSLLHNQLVIVGSLVSNNTYGGSLQLPPRLGDGALAVTPDQIRHSRLQDLNFLRYAKIQTVELFGGFFQLNCWSDDTKLSRFFYQNEAQAELPPSDDNICQFVNNPDDKSIMNIIFRAPRGDQPVFELVRQE